MLSTWTCLIHLIVSAVMCSDFVGVQWECAGSKSTPTFGAPERCAISMTARSVFTMPQLNSIAMVIWYGRMRSATARAEVAILHDVRLVLRRGPVDVVGADHHHVAAERGDQLGVRDVLVVVRRNLRGRAEADEVVVESARHAEAVARDDRASNT